MTTLRYRVDTQLARLLAENYRSSEAALKELVDNAWDADAETVRISLPAPMTQDPIVIDDDGSGMTETELQQEYLLIASGRTQGRGELTVQKKRRAKGRKGIGKFAGLMAAQTMQLETWARGQRSGFTLSASDYQAAGDIEQLKIPVASEPDTNRQHGTVITLTDLNQSLAFPDPDKLRQLLLQDYGREEDFRILVNGKLLGVDDVQGSFSEHAVQLPNVGQVKLRFAIADRKSGLRQPGISIRVGGKVVGKPDFFGLDAADDFPPKLLNKLYGEIEADGLVDHVTADWGAMLDRLETLCRDPATLEKQIHEALEANLWVFGLDYSFFSSNKTLKRQVEDLLGKQYTGERGDRRPDLLLTMNFANAYLLIEFKRPSHTLTFQDYQQSTGYRNDLGPYVQADMRILVIGGGKGPDVRDKTNWEPNTELLVYEQLIARARNQLEWLLKELSQ